MRKRLVIGAIAVVVIGVAAYMLSQPRKGTVEYHKREYLKAGELGVFGEWINRGPMALQDLYWEPKYKRIDFHRAALLEAGYLAQREFVVSNRAATDVRDELYRIRFDVFTDTNDIAGIPFFYRPATNKIKVVARAIDMEKWEEAIRKFDAPETK